MEQGLLIPGNIDINKRKVLRNHDGSISTESSISIGTDEGEVLIPTVVNGKRLSDNDAINHYKQTGQHLGVFRDVQSANLYAEKLHNSQESRYSTMPLPMQFAPPISAITGKPEPSFEQKAWLGKAMFDYLKGNLFPNDGQNVSRQEPMTPDMNPVRFINPNHPQYQPSIFGEPNANINLGQSGIWKKPLRLFLQFTAKTPGAKSREIAKATGLSEYEIDTIKELLKHNKFMGNQWQPEHFK